MTAALVKCPHLLVQGAPVQELADHSRKVAAPKTTLHLFDCVRDRTCWLAADCSSRLHLCWARRNDPARHQSWTP